MKSWGWPQYGAPGTAPTIHESSSRQEWHPVSFQLKTTWLGWEV